MTDPITQADPARWLGRKVHDLTSGLKGVCNTVVLECTGNVLVGIQPGGDGKSKPESFMFDAQTVEDVGAGLGAGPTPQAPAFAIGERVAHVAAPFKGTVLSIGWWLNGCVQYGVAADALDRDGSVSVHHFLQPVLKPAGEPRNTALAPPAGAKATGGPARRVERP